MSIQDSYFDVRAALEGKSELELFDNLMAFYFNLELQSESLETENIKLKQTIRIMLSNS